MRYSRLNICGKEYTLVMSTRVIAHYQEMGKDISTILDEGGISGIMDMLQRMIEAGDRYARMEGMDNPGVLTLDEILDATGPEDYAGIIEAVTLAVTGERKVEAEPDPKNADSTPA